MPDWLAVVILGIIEGITEFLPVSSTGHLLLAEHLLKLKESDLFNIVIQCGAVIAVLPLFPERLYKFVFEWREPETRDYLLKIAAAFFITGAIGFGPKVSISSSLTFSPRFSRSASVRRVNAPGEIVFTVQPYFASSNASTRVKPAMPAFAAP